MKKTISRFGPLFSLLLVASVVQAQYLVSSKAGFVNRVEGKVHIKVQGSLHELQAITDDETQIATGKLVKVKAVINDSVLIVTSDLS